MSQAYANTQGADTQCGAMIHKAARHVERLDADTIETAGAATYTAAQILGGIIVRDCAGSGRTDVLPTAALLLAELRDEQVGDIIECLVVNNSDGDETITIAAGDGGDFVQIAGTRIIPQNTSRKLYIRITDTATPAYAVYM